MPSDDRRREAATKYFTDLAERRCPFCQKRVVLAEQVGRCVYFNPCGHRLGQGSAAGLMKVWEEEGL